MQDCLSFFVETGAQYTAPVPFGVARVWAMHDKGLLLEREPVEYVVPSPYASCRCMCMRCTVQN